MMKKKTKGTATSFLSRFLHRLIGLSKRIYPLKYIDQKSILFIVGCQRSGTTLMTSIFDKDFNTKVYGEFSELSSNDANNIRLNELRLVKKEIYTNKAGKIVMKPIVETQNCLKLIDFFEDSRALFMFRNYKDVVASNLKKFGINNGISDLWPIVKNQKNNWRAENVSDYTRNIVLEHYSENMNPYDAAALFWISRNRLFFELELDKNPKVMMCKYEDIGLKPLWITKGIYEFLGWNYPGKRIIRDVYSSSIYKGKKIKLSPEIEQTCRELLLRLERVYHSQN